MKVLNYLEFRDGFNYIKDTQIIFRPLSEYFVLHNYIVKKYSKDRIKEIFREAAIEDGYICYERIKKSLKLKNKESENNNLEFIKIFLEHISLLGFGEVSLKYLIKDKIEFSHKKYFASKSYEYNYGETPEVLVEEILGAYIENFLSFHFGKKVKVLTIKKGNNISYNAKITDEKFTFKPKYSYPKKEKSKIISTTLKTIIYKNQIKKEDGVITMTGIEVHITPYLYLIKLIELIYDKELVEFFKLYGVAIGRAEYSWIKPVVKNDPIKHIDKICETFLVNGLGNAYFCQKNNEFIYNNNFGWYIKYFDEKILNLIK